MSLVIDYFTGFVVEYRPEADLDEWVVCSIPLPERLNVGHSIHNSFRMAKLAQLKLKLRGVDAWIEHTSAFGPPSCEDQLDADILLAERKGYIKGYVLGGPPL